MEDLYIFNWLGVVDNFSFDSISWSRLMDRCIRAIFSSKLNIVRKQLHLIAVLSTQPHVAFLLAKIEFVDKHCLQVA